MCRAFSGTGPAPVPSRTRAVPFAAFSAAWVCATVRSISAALAPLGAAITVSAAGTTTAGAAAKLVSNPRRDRRHCSSAICIPPKELTYAGTAIGESLTRTTASKFQNRVEGLRRGPKARAQTLPSGETRVHPPVRIPDPLARKCHARRHGKPGALRIRALERAHHQQVAWGERRLCRSELIEKINDGPDQLLFEANVEMPGSFDIDQIGERRGRREAAQPLRHAGVGHGIDDGMTDEKRGDYHLRHPARRVAIAVRSTIADISQGANFAKLLAQLELRIGIPPRDDKEAIAVAFRDQLPAFGDAALVLGMGISGDALPISPADAAQIVVASRECHTDDRGLLRARHVVNDLRDRQAMTKEHEAFVARPLHEFHCGRKIEFAILERKLRIG